MLEGGLRGVVLDILTIPMENGICRISGFVIMIVCHWMVAEQIPVQIIQ